MSFPSDLLELAEFLAKRERQRPRQSSLRRSVSTAYYALFHLLTADSASLIGAYMNPHALLKVQRWLDHAEMKRICGMFSVPGPAQSFADVLGAPISADLQKVAQAFISLQNARHEADYNLASTWTRLKTQQQAEAAKDAFEAWGRIRRSHEANVFALALLSPKLFEKRR